MRLAVLAVALLSARTAAAAPCFQECTGSNLPPVILPLPGPLPANGRIFVHGFFLDQRPAEEKGPAPAIDLSRDGYRMRLHGPENISLRRIVLLEPQVNSAGQYLFVPDRRLKVGARYELQYRTAQSPAWHTLHNLFAGLSPLGSGWKAPFVYTATPALETPPPFANRPLIQAMQAPPDLCGGRWLDVVAHRQGSIAYFRLEVERGEEKRSVARLDEGMSINLFQDEPCEPDRLGLGTPGLLRVYAVDVAGHETVMPGPPFELPGTPLISGPAR